MKSYKWLSISLISLATSLSTSLAHSQEQGQEPAAQEQTSATPEVVVTARRRAESVQDVPISIVSKTGESLQRSGVQSITELARVVPGFVFNEFEAGQQSTAQLRGLSSFGFQTHAPQSVGVVVDDVVLDLLGQSMNSFNDIERIEVLRGPQGTLFGRNTTGGVVHIVTKDPTDDFEAKLSASYGSYDEIRWNGMINSPLGDKWAIRASAFTVDRDGYIKNVLNGDMLNEERQAGVTSKLQYDPREGTRLKLTTTYIERRREGSSSSGGDPVVALGPASTNKQRLVNESLVGPENDRVNGVGSQPFDETVGTANLTWNQDIGDFALTSVSAFSYWQFEFGEAADYVTFQSPIPPLFWRRAYVPNLLHSWSQEVRLASPQGRRVEYVAGIFASSMKLFEGRDYIANVSPDPDPAGAFYFYTHADQNTKHTDYAFFGEADFHLTDTVTLIGGMRWTRDKTDVDLDAGAAPDDPQYFGFLDSEFPGFQTMSISENKLTWRGGLRFEPTPDLMFYSTVSRGFKGPTITALALLAPVKSENSTNYEVGTKAQFFDHRVIASLSVYHADTDDFQAQAADQIETPQGEPVPLIFLTNAAKVRAQGAELELSVTPTDQFSLDFGAAYNDAKFVRFPGAGCYPGQAALATGCDESVEPAVQDLSGKRMPLVPKWSGSAMANYEFKAPLWNTTPFVRLDYTYRSEINWESSLSPTAVSDAVGIWGLALGLRGMDDRLEIVGAVKNLTDEFYVNSLSGGLGQVRARLTPQYQRTWNVAFNYRFQ